MSWNDIKQLFTITLFVAFVTASLSVTIPLWQGYKYLSVQSGSMIPAIQKGDLVVVKSVPHYGVGDVITFASQDQKTTITHRISQVSENQNGPKQFTTKGDANSQNDAPVSEGRVVGKVDFTVPKLGFVFDFLRHPIGLILMIYIPALIVVGHEIRLLARYYKSREPYIAAGAVPKLIKRINLKPAGKAVMLFAGIATLLTAGPVYALLQSTVTLTGNTISTATVPDNQADHLLVHQVILSGGNGSVCAPENVNASIANTGPGSVNAIINNSNCSINSSNNTIININVNNSQNAASGNASGNNATSGNATNNSTTNVNINVNNNGPPAVNGQSVVLFNPTGSPVDLTGWTLADNDGTHNIPAVTIGAGAFVTVNWPVANGLAKTGDRIILSDPSIVAIDSVNWGSDTSQFNPSVGTSNSTTAIIRHTATLDTDSSGDWIEIN